MITTVTRRPGPSCTRHPKARRPGLRVTWSGGEDHVALRQRPPPPAQHQLPLVAAPWAGRLNHGQCVVHGIRLRRTESGGQVSIRVDVAPSMVTWARQRSGRDPKEFEKSFPWLNAWERGDLAPTLKQLENFAHATYTPVGYFFLREPPEEELPVPDFRTMSDTGVSRPSPNLLDTVFLCEQRQEWYRDFARQSQTEALDFIGSVSLRTPIVAAAEAMRTRLGFELANRAGYSTWTDAIRGLIEAAEAIGVLVMVSGIVASNTHRKLNPKEFRGFALVDSLAPLIFVNGADTKAAQIFTLAHELAHLWVGQSAVSKPDLDAETDNPTERWCNQVAAEFLVPLDALPSRLEGPTLTDDLDRLAKTYKVSTLVILRRLYDAGFFKWERFRRAYVDEMERVIDLAERTGTGGNFYNTQPYRVSRRFARAIIANTLEGETLHRDAFRLLGVRKVSTFEEFGEYLGIA